MFKNKNIVIDTCISIGINFLSLFFEDAYYIGCCTRPFQKDVLCTRTSAFGDYFLPFQRMDLNCRLKAMTSSSLSSEDYPSLNFGE